MPTIYVVVRAAVLGALAACGAAAHPAIENRGDDTKLPPVEPMLGERGFRGHDDGSMPLARELETWLPGATAHVSDASIVVELRGVPQSKLVGGSVPADIALLVTENGRIVDVFAREVTMPHRLEVGMTLERAKQLQPTLTCVSAMDATTCTLPRSRFSFRIFEDATHAARIDHVTWVRL